MQIKNIIIDADPGVDDATALTIALNNKNININLITTTAGNVGIKKTTRNILHLVEKFNKDTKVYKGAKKPLKRKSKSATHVHGKEGLGGYIPTKPKLKIQKGKAIDAIYNALKNSKERITLVELGPHTNLGKLFLKYPDCEKYIEEIIFEGGSPYGQDGIAPHISFNISFDPEAADIVMKTKLPKTIIPSELGRFFAHFTPEQVKVIEEVNETGKFLSTMYKSYVNIQNLGNTQTNDLCAIMYLLYPEIFDTFKCDIEIDLNDIPGKTIITRNPKGLISFVEYVDREEFFNKFIENLKNINIPTN